MYDSIMQQRSTESAPLVLHPLEQAGNDRRTSVPCVRAPYSRLFYAPLMASEISFLETARVSHYTSLVILPDTAGD